MFYILTQHAFDEPGVLEEEDRTESFADAYQIYINTVLASAKTTTTGVFAYWDHCEITDAMERNRTRLNTLHHA